MKSQQNGSILIAILIMMPFFMLITIAYLQLSTTGFRVAKQDQFHTHAQFAADAAVDASVEALGLDDNWPGTTGQVVLHNDGNIVTKYEAAVTPVDADHKTLVVTGRTYHPASAVTPSATVSLEVGVRGVQSGALSLVSGVGGLVMKNSAKIVSGNAYINGTVTMSNSSQIGLSNNPVDVKVAHQTCPSGANPGATFPRVCASGENGQPINISGTAHIYGTVQATNQTTGAGMTDSGLVPGSAPPPVVLPDYDRTAHKNDANAADAANTPDAQTGGSAGCNNGTKTWPANLKINGDVTISGTCIVTVEGKVWITGNLLMRNSAQIKVKNGLTAAPVIMIDGSTGLQMRNSANFVSNTGLIGFRVITYANSTGNPDAAITGTNLYNSKNLITIDIDNSASGAQTEFYARWSKLTAGNGGSIGALVAQTVELKNSLAVTFGTSVTGLTDTIWIIDDYKRIFN